VVGVPLIVYGAWYVAYGESFGETRSKWLYTDDLPPFLDVARFAIECAGSTVGALVGAGSTAGQVLLLPVLAVIVVGFVRADSTRRPRLLALVAIPVVFWIGLGFSRLGIATPDSSRYLYPAAVFVVLLLGECLRGVRVPPVALVAVVAVVGWSLVWNFGEFTHGRDFLLESSRQTRVELGAINLGTRRVDARYAAARTPVRRHLRPWLAAFDDLGFPGATPAQITDESERFRRQADAVLVYTAGVHLAPARGAAGRAPVVTTGGPGTPDGESCLALRSAGTPVDAELVARTPALRIEALGAPVAVRVRHFARGYFADAKAWETIHTGKARSLWLPAVAGGDWTVGVSTPTRVRVCGVAEPR
jgi:hypothetical protein